MDNRYKNILPSKKNMVSSDEDIFFNIDLESESKAILPYTNQKILNISNLFNTERQATQKYRFSGQIDGVSPFFNIKKTSNKISDLFDYKDIFDIDKDFFSFNDFFDVYLVIPEKFVKLSEGKYALYGKAITSLDETNLFKSGYSTNIYNEKIFQYIFNKDIDLTDRYIYSSDNTFRFPITDLLLFFNYKNNAPYPHEYENLNDSNDIVVLNGTQDLANDIYCGTFDIDLPNYDILSNTYSQSYINLTYTDINLKFKYTPFAPLKIKYFSTDSENGNILNTDNIPFYAYLLDDETNDFNKSRNEIFINSTNNIFSGSTRLTLNDPINTPERKFIYNTKTKFYEYYLDNDIYDKTYFKFYLNNVLLEEGLDFIVSDSAKNKIMLRFKPFLNDILRFDYFTGLNYVWRDLLDIGFFDTETGIGVDYPFVNGYHYKFDNVKLFIKPDFSDQETNDFYCKFVFNTSTQNSNPNTNILNLNC